MTNEQYMKNLIEISKDFDLYNQVFMVAFQIRQNRELQYTQAYIDWLEVIGQIINDNDESHEKLDQAARDVRTEFERLGLENETRVNGCKIQEN